MSSETMYEGRDLMALGKFYTDHLAAMTAEQLESKSDIAAELAWRDARIAELEAGRRGAVQEQDDRFPNGLADAITYADAAEEAAAALHAQVLGYESDGSGTAVDMLRDVSEHLKRPTPRYFKTLFPSLRTAAQQEKSDD